MIEFLLNDQLIQTREPEGLTVLDYVRYNKRLTGTKIGCREGDCGACVVLIGDLQDGKLFYSSMTSCLMPIRNAHGKHIVTIEGLNMQQLNPVQAAVVAQMGTQCGFCTPGFVVSLSGFMLNDVTHDRTSCIAAMDGNICRCTGYKSLERAADTIVEHLQTLKGADHLEKLLQSGAIPTWFRQIPQKMHTMQERLQSASNGTNEKGILIGGGTDLWVQRPEEMVHSDLQPVFVKDTLRLIYREGDTCVVGAAATPTDMLQSELFNSIFSRLTAFMKLISSLPIRNMGTVGGNLINASPIGDLTIFFLALDSEITLQHMGKRRRIKLRDFYLDYKKMDKIPEEMVEEVRFSIPEPNDFFNFEKVSKRTHLDIASANTAACIRVKEGIIEKAHISAGGVGPIPLYLKQTSKFITGKPLNTETLAQAITILSKEISPISDARGSADYKRRLLRQLVLAHFAEGYSDSISNQEIITLAQS